MNIFERIKQHNTANTNLDMRKVSNSELEEFIPGLPLIDRHPLKEFRDILFNDMLALLLNRARKMHQKKKVYIEYCVAAATLAAVEAGMNACHILTQKNPAAGEVLKRHLKDKMASW